MEHSSTSHKNQPGELFLVATPIGNLADITLRALEVLKAVDRIACEDTRTSGMLLKHYGIRTPMTSYHDHNEATASASLVAAMLQGERMALISDAGTPLLSDPGARLVKAAIAAGLRVTPIPGASALLAGLTIAGLPAERFTYAGFLANKSGERIQQIQQLAHVPMTLIFYEAPHRLLATLTDLHTMLGERSAAVARELTKLHEECVRGTLAELVQHFTTTAPRGECVILVDGAIASVMEADAIDRALRDAMARGSVKEAVAEVATLSGRAKSDVYARALALKGGDA